MRKLLKYGIAILLVLVICAAVVSASAASYILGDTDGDGEVSVLDAALVQRVMAYMADDPDGDITLRGDIDRNGDLEPIDVTYILRYNVYMSTPYPVGELIEDPTEPETQAPTEAPTQAPTQRPTAKPDPYELPPI